jgi:hypothetical protein
MENLHSRFSQIEKRLNLQSIGEFIRNGSEVEVDRHGFVEREAKAYDKLREAVSGVCGAENAEAVLRHIGDYAGVQEDIYFTLGMKVGAQIVVQLNSNFEADY